MKKNILIIKIGSTGNLLNIERSLQRLDVNFVYFSSATDLNLTTIDKIILPGVGNFKDAMNTIHKDLNVIKNLILAKPTLGICLGMQILAKYGYEDGETLGLGLIDGEVVKMNVKEKVPHLGWNTLIHRKNNPLFTDINPNDNFYFMHSYEFINYTNYVSLTNYSNHNFVSAINKEHIYGVQFHPEKSGDAGLKLLSNFIHLT
jgi:imidazole glycerol phosphate synthase glutamine amidotransferase subunit